MLSNRETLKHIDSKYIETKFVQYIYPNRSFIWYLNMMVSLMGIKVETLISYLTIRYTYMYERRNSSDKKLLFIN